MSADPEEIVVVVTLLRKDGAALMQQRDHKPGLRHAGLWGMPGGHCEPGETWEISARRELAEETGYTCDTLHWLTVIEHGSDDGWPPYRLVAFWALYDGVQPIRCLEGQAVQFIERHRAGEYPMPGYLAQVWDAAIAAMTQQHQVIRP